MKKIVVIIVLVLVSIVVALSFETQEVSQEVEETQKIGVVHRTFVRQQKRRTDKLVRLQDGTILSGEFIGSLNTQISDFCFVEKGDTVIYNGEKVIEVKFKN